MRISLGFEGIYKKCMCCINNASINLHEPIIKQRMGREEKCGCYKFQCTFDTPAIQLHLYGNELFVFLQTTAIIIIGNNAFSNTRTNCQRFFFFFLSSNETRFGCKGVDARFDVCAYEYKSMIKFLC